MTALAIVCSSELHRSQLQTNAMSSAGFQAFYRRVTPNTNWELGFRQSSFHHIARALRNRPYNAIRP